MGLCIAVGACGVISVFIWAVFVCGAVKHIVFDVVALWIDGFLCFKRISVHGLSLIYCNLIW